MLGSQFVAVSPIFCTLTRVSLSDWHKKFFSFLDKLCHVLVTSNIYSIEEGSDLTVKVE